MGEREWNEAVGGESVCSRFRRVNVAVTARELVENTQAIGIGGRIPSAPASLKALRFAPTATRRAEDARP